MCIEDIHTGMPFASGAPAVVPVDNTDKNHRKIWRKSQKIFAHFFLLFSVFFSKISYDPPQCCQLVPQLERHFQLVHQSGDPHYKTSVYVIKMYHVVLYFYKNRSKIIWFTAFCTITTTHQATLL